MNAKVVDARAAFLRRRSEHCQQQIELGLEAAQRILDGIAEAGDLAKAERAEALLALDGQRFVIDLDETETVE